jgi:nucleotide-binding universal stress UspA family protein
MNPFKHVLSATDFGEPAERALEAAIVQASKFEARLTLLHASWVPPLVYAAYVDGLSWPVEEMTDAARKELDLVLSKARQRYARIEGVMMSGEPWRTILDVAKERDVDLIVMGTHGRHGLSRVLLGSVAEKVVRLSPVPVLTVSGKADEAAKQALLAGVTEKRG